MSTVAWKDFEANAPELARFGFERLHGGVAYLATIRMNQLPRLHPVTPIIGDGHLYLFMEPTSPKGKDLERGSPYVLHSTVVDDVGSNGEFQLTGYGDRKLDKADRDLAVSLAAYEIEAHYILFELSVLEAFSTIYRNDDAVRTKWNSSST